MGLYELVDKIKNMCSSLPEVNRVYVGDVTQLNTNQNVIYPCMVISQGTHTTDTRNSKVTYTFNIFAVDLLLSDESNRLLVQSWALHLLQSLCYQLDDTELLVKDTYNMTVFTERFDSLCAGAYATIQIQTDLNACVNSNYK